MKRNFLVIIAFMMGSLMSSGAFGQSPSLGSASNYALFTSVGAFTNSGASVVTGDLGTNVGAFTGFPPGTVIGSIHVADAASTSAATDVSIAYNYLNSLTCGNVIGVGLGSGQILTPNVYCIGAASTLNGTLTLDALGNPNAIFVIKIDGAFSTGVAANVLLVNGASMCNVYWQVNGQFDLGSNSVFRGILISNGAINLLAGSTLYGKALSSAGAITMDGNIVSTSTSPIVAAITGNTNICVGKTTTLSNSTTGGEWNSSDILQSTVDNSGVVTGVLQGVPTINYTVTNSLGCITRVGTPITVNKNTSLATITGASGICIGSTTTLSGTPVGGTWISNDGAVASVTNAGVVSGLSAGSTQFIYTNTATTCSATSLDITVNAATTSSTTIANCGSYIWNGVSYAATGTYTKTFLGGNSTGCDSVATLHLTVNAATSSSTTIANCGSYVWNGVSYAATGTYTKTFFGGNSAGCDSVATLHLTVNASTSSSTTIANCSSYIWNGISYAATGTYTKTFLGGNSTGCDSVATLHLTVNSATSSSTTFANCGSYVWNGVSYAATGTYTKTFLGSNSTGCDSVATLHLTVNAATSSSTTIANCGSYIWNGVSYAATGTYTKTFLGGNSTGCDSLATLHLTVNAATNSSTTIANCGSYVWNGVNYLTSGTYTKTFLGGNSTGCDSVAALHLTVNAATNSSTTIANCGSYVWNGVSYAATGTYTKTFLGGNSTGCDSVATLHLTVNSATSSSTTIANCGSYFWNGVSYAATGTYTKTFLGGNSTGCDSVATLHLTVNAATSSSTTIANCGSYIWNGVSYAATGTYTKTFLGGNSNGCDSLATLHLTVNAATNSSTTIANCGSYVWNGVSYPATGTYTKTFLGGNSTGCDSVATLHLTVNAATSSSTTIANCGSYIWNGVSYAATGSYTKTFLGGNSTGCDSVATLHLTINSATSSSTTTSACDSYLWNGVNYLVSGTFTKTFIGGNSTGCDSVATLNLTVNHPTYSSKTVLACGCLTYIWNGVTYTTNGDYTITLIGANSVGCDSIATLHLTIVAPIGSEITIATCSNYLWNGVTYTASGNYAKTFTSGSSTGCDSVATLHLTINTATSSTTTINTSGIYVWNGVSYSASGTYTKTFTGGNSNGCDSVATLILTINPPTSSTTTITNCGSYLWNGVTYTVSGSYAKTFLGGSSTGSDSTATLNLTVNAATTSTTTISNCGSYVWNGVTYSVSGTYTKTFLGGNSTGCDSVATLHLTINTSTSSTTTINTSGSYVWNGVNYSASGTYTKTFLGGNSTGCDSVATLLLTINPPTSSTTTIANCGSYLWNGVTYTVSGSYAKTFLGGSSTGSDSTATLNLTVNAATVSSTTIANCGSYIWNGVSYSVSGTYIKTFLGGNSTGCDSVATLNLTVNSATSSSTTINTSGSYVWNGVSYSASGTYTKTFTGGNSNGCDSVATLLLTINPPTSSTTTIANCGSYLWNGVTYTVSGTYTKTFLGGSSTGSDSTATLNLTVNNATVSSTFIANCGSYVWNGVSYSVSGTYNKTFLGGNSTGCDSVASLNLTVNSATSSSTTINTSGIYVWNGVSYSASGTYIKTFTGGNSNGCDSVTTLLLTINPPTSSTTTIANCGSYLWNGVTYTVSGTYTKTFIGGSSTGSDSTATLNLTVNNATSSSTMIANCGSYVWNGISYSISGTYTKTFTSGNSTGCDSVATLNLTVNSVTSSTTTISTSGIYVWNGVSYSASGTYTKTFTGGNSNGCDSVATLLLTINPPTSSTTTIANCGSYLWNGVTYTVSGTYTKTFLGGSSTGSDSVATLNLTVNDATVSSTTIANCGSYVWNGVTYSVSGTYNKTFTGGNNTGCDSVATLYLTVNSATSSSTTINTSGIYVWNGVSYAISGTYTKTFTGGNSTGCDSIATLLLTINPPTSSTTTIANCGSYLWNGVTYTVSGTYTKTFLGGSSTGSDSTAILILTVNNTTYSTLNVDVCGSLGYTWNDINYTTSGTYTHTYTGGNSTGCDSIATIILTLNVLPTTPHFIIAPISVFGMGTPNTVFGIRTGIEYSVIPIAGVMSYKWAYSGKGAIIHNNGMSSITIDFSDTATSGYLTVQSVSVSGCLSIAESVAITVSSTLPVLLSDFKAMKQESQVVLNWTSLSEINISKFNIERSENGIDFVNIGSVMAKGPGIYKFNDNSISSSDILYYQLEMISSDGVIQYSNVLTLNNYNSVSGISIYPNPAKDMVTIISKIKSGHLTICNQLGKTILSQMITDTQNRVNLNGLASGIYFINILSAEGKMTSKLIIK